MRRNAFLQLVLGATSGLALPLHSFARRLSEKARERLEKGFMVAAGKDRSDKSISLFEGDTFYAKVSTGDTNGDIYMFESSREKKGGPPLHVHPEQDEWWYVLKGEFMIKVGEGEAKLLMFFQPAGKMEAFFTAMSQGATKDMTPEQSKEFRKAHGFEVVGPALTYLKQ